MSFQSSDLTSSQLEFMRENYLATLTTLRPNGSPHVVPVGFTFDIDNNIVRVITFAKSMKARHAAQGGRAVVSQVDRGRWITLEGTVRLRTEAEIIAKAVDAYASRYRAGALARQAYLPFKVNATGVMPVIFASTLLALPTGLVRYAPALEPVAAALGPTGPLYLPVRLFFSVFPFSFFPFSFFFFSFRSNILRPRPKKQQKDKAAHLESLARLKKLQWRDTIQS